MFFFTVFTFFLDGKSVKTVKKNKKTCKNTAKLFFLNGFYAFFRFSNKNSKVQLGRLAGRGLRVNSSPATDQPMFVCCRLSGASPKRRGFEPSFMLEHARGKPCSCNGSSCSCDESSCSYAH